MNTKEVTIRRAGPGDEIVLAAIGSSVHELHVTNEPEYFKRLDSDRLQSWFATLLARPTARVWLATHGTAAIGYVAAEIRAREANPFSPPRRWIEVDQLGVLPSHRRKGVARTLIGKVLEEARGERIDELSLGVWSFNSVAREAFERLGFRPTLTRFTRKVDDG